MFHVFMIQNCLGSLLGLVNSLKTFSSSMCRNCGSWSEFLHISSAHHGLLPSPMATSIMKQPSLRSECSHGLEETLGRKKGERKKSLALMESLLYASHFALL